MSAKNETQKSFSLAGQSRESSRVANEALKQENKIPAVIYGKDFPNVNISVKLTDFEKVYRAARKSSFIDLIINEKETYKVLCNAIQIDYTGKIIHADFYKINEKEEITAEVSLNFIGESPAKKAGFNVLLQTTAIKVKCLPKDLMSSLDVDISKLEAVEQNIKVSDLVLPKDLNVLNHGDEIVAIVKQAVEIDTKVDNTDNNMAAQQAAEAAEAAAKAAANPEAAKVADKSNDKEDKK